MDMSLQMYGCRVVQKAFEHALDDQQAELIAELNAEASVMRLIKDNNGNHVIQQALKCIAPRHVSFIYAHLRGKVRDLIHHQFGCRVVQRMLERADDEQRREIVAEIRECGGSIVTDQYGNYVAQHVIEHGDRECRDWLIGLCARDVPRYARHKFASNVVEKCIVFGSVEQRGAFCRALVDDGGPPGSAGSAVVLRDVAMCAYGNYVVRKSFPLSFLLFVSCPWPILSPALYLSSSPSGYMVLCAVSRGIYICMYI